MLDSLGACVEVLFEYLCLEDFAKLRSVSQKYSGLVFKLARIPLQLLDTEWDQELVSFVLDLLKKGKGTVCLDLTSLSQTEAFKDLLRDTSCQIQKLKLSGTQLEDLVGAKIKTLELNKGSLELCSLLAKNHLENVILSSIKHFRVSGFSEALESSRILHLDLSANNLGTRGIELLKVNNSQVRVLNLSSNQINDSGLEKLTDNLVGSQVVTLDLSYNLLEYQGVCYLCYQLPFTSVLDLNLECNSIVNEGCSYFPQAVLKLQSLSIRSNQIGDSGLSLVFENLPNSSLKKLFIGENLISDVVVRSLSTRITKSCLEELDISLYELNECNLNYLLKAIPSLRKLTLSKTEVTNLPETPIADSIVESKLTYLDLSDSIFLNGIASNLACSIPESCLKVLNLTRSLVLDSDCLDELFRSIKGSLLESLSLASNNLTDKNLIDLAESLKDSNLKCLDLSNNRLKDTTAMARGIVLSKLEVLDLSKNSVESKGFKLILGSLNNCQLKKLNFANNKIQDEGLCTLLNSVSTSKLSFLNLAGNLFSESGTQMLQELDVPKLVLNLI